MNQTYVHGYHPRENERLQDQAGTLEDLLHTGTVFPAGSKVLEAGCGVGAQTLALARRSPEIEGDHGATCFHPDSDDARAAIQCQVELQHRAGGNAQIGRQLCPLLAEAGFKGVRVRPRMVYVDASRPELADGFTRKTFIAMIEGVRQASVAAGLIEPERFDAGLQALHRTAGADGVFCYTFFKGVAEKA
jgi:hypothetical protein